MYKLYLDESGKPALSQSISPQETHFSFGAALVHKNAEEFLYSRADQIRFKYWGHNSKVVFHGYEIRKNQGPFSIFRNNPTREAEFRQDLLQYIQACGFRFIW